MTKSEAIQVIELCSNWNTAQEGISLEEQKLFDVKRATLLKAWETLGELTY
jgi:hypothetical protein